MFRHKPEPPDSSDALLTGALADRSQVARDRLEYQVDPALTAALSVREIDDERALAERIRDAGRNEQLARIKEAEDMAARVRHTAAKLAEREAADLLRARKALAEQRQAASPHAKIARLHRRKAIVLGILTAAVVFAMAFSAVTVQHNIIPHGGPANLMWWMAYGLEALISGMLIALMLSTSDTVEWDVIEDPRAVYAIEGLLLALTVGLNIYPYAKAGDWFQTVVHSIAPITVGTALATHSVVSRRYGAAIAKATAAAPAADDINARLLALTQISTSLHAVHPAASYPPAPSETVHHATVLGEPTVHPALDAAPETVHRAPAPTAETVQTPCTEQTETVQTPRTEQTVHLPETVHRAPVQAERQTVHDEVRTEQDTVHSHPAPHRTGGEAEAPGAEIAQVQTPRRRARIQAGATPTEQTPSSETAASVHSARETVQPTPSADTAPAPDAATVQPGTVQKPRTEQTETVQKPCTEQTVHLPETVHRATVHGTETVQPPETVQPETAHRAGEPATDRYSVEDVELWQLAVEVHSRLKRTKFSVEDVAKVLIANRRDGLAVDRIYRDKIGPHRDVTGPWLKLAAQIEQEYAPVIALRDRG